jgi:molecular chaperone GrpE
MDNPKKASTKEKIIPPEAAPIDPKEVHIQELTNTLQRLQAEFDNYRKRMDKETEDKKQVARASVIKNLLPVLDSFEQAVKTDTSEGLARLYAQLVDALEREGLKPIPTRGQFDPYQHEVLLTEKKDQEEGTILEELQKGYTYKGTLLRTSKVKVSAK